MDIFKQYKETESKFHKSLYTNLLLLSQFYPTTEQFNAIFKKDMFVKNNKAAFFEVIYYLLNILNRELTKKHLTSWPPYDLKREAKFRSEVIAYLNTLNSTYENADIPACQASSLISPGGFRFVKIMLKISQLVVYEHLKNTDEYSILYRLKLVRKSPAVNDTQKCGLERVTKLIDKESKAAFLNFNKSCLEVSEKAKEMQTKMDQLNKDIQNNNKLLEKAQLEFNNKYSSYPSLSSLEEQLLALKQRIEKVLELNNMFCSSEALLKYLGGSNMTLEHNKENFTVPNVIAHIITNKEELDTSQFFEGVSKLLEKATFQLQSPSLSLMEHTKTIIENFTEKNQRIFKQLESEQEQISNKRDALKDFIYGLHRSQYQ